MCDCTDHKDEIPAYDAQAIESKCCLLYTSLLPDEPFDCHGVYSGSALAEDGRIRVLYTGNVKLSDADGTYDYVNTCLLYTSFGRAT